MKMMILLATLCFVIGVLTGVFADRRLNPVQVYDCEVIDYNKVEEIVAKQVITHQVQPLDVEKIKHVKEFTYAPVLQLPDTCCPPCP